MNAQLLKAFLEPILEVKFLILSAHGLDELASLNGKDALFEHVKARCFGISLHSFSLSLVVQCIRTLAEGMMTVSGNVSTVAAAFCGATLYFTLSIVQASGIVKVHHTLRTNFGCKIVGFSQKGKPHVTRIRHRASFPSGQNLSATWVQNPCLEGKNRRLRGGGYLNRRDLIGFNGLTF
jgi:hypothetical protein